MDMIKEVLETVKRRKSLLTTWSLRIRRSCGLFSQVAQSCRAVARAWA